MADKKQDADKKDKKAKKPAKKAGDKAKKPAKKAGDPVERKIDFSPFLNGAAEPPAEETPEEKARREAAEKARREAAEKGLQEAIRYTFQLHEQMAATIKTTAEQAAPLISSMQQMRDFAAFMGEWARKTRQERDAFYIFLETSTAEIMKAVDGETAESIASLKEYLFEVWYELQRDPAFREQYADISLPELLKPEPDENGEMITPFRLLLEQAKRRKKGNAIAPYRAENYDYSVARQDLFLWDLPATQEQIAMNFDLSRQGSGDGAVLFFSLDFDDVEGLKFPKTIDHYDRRMMGALATAFNLGITRLSYKALYFAMGGKGRPGANDYDRMDKALSKLDAGKLYLDNIKEHEVYPNYPHYHYDDRLVHIRRNVELNVNGKVTDGAVEIFAEPALLEFSRVKNQITTVPIEVLQSPVSKTNNHLKIEDYLLRVIARQKRKLNQKIEEQNKKYNQKREKEIAELRNITILLSTFYERTGNSKKDATGKKRARETAESYLNHYASEEGKTYISDYKIEKDRIKILLPRQ